MWEIADLDLDAYLDRIGVSSSPTVASVHAGHVNSIPFENITVLLGELPALDLPSIQAKMVTRRRGGYCYEHNSLYAAALERLGFTVRRLAARSRAAGGAEVRPRTHMMLLATVDDVPHLTDVGWGGGGLIEPMPLREGTMRQGEWTFRLVHDDDLWTLQSLRAGRWVDLYMFAIEPTFPSDYVMANLYTATWPRSAFVGKLVVQVCHSDMRLVGNQLTISGPEGIRSQETLTDDEVLDALRQRFGIELNDDELGRLTAKLAEARVGTG
jgi:N-hydroxyarylamine O-acetyltransferase